MLLVMDRIVRDLESSSDRRLLLFALQIFSIYLALLRNYVY